VLIHPVHHFGLRKPELAASLADANGAGQIALGHGLVSRHRHLHWRDVMPMAQVFAYSEIHAIRDSGITDRASAATEGPAKMIIVRRNDH
jgi:hypothetical protein